MTRWEFIKYILGTSFFWLNIVAFFIGMVVVPFLYQRYAQKKWFHPLLKLAHFYKGITHKILNLRLGMVALIVFIFLANSLTATLVYLSGFIPYLPVVYILLTGFMVRLVTILEEIEAPLVLMIFNPVTVMEVVAISIAGALGLQLTLTPAYIIQITGSVTRLQAGYLYFVHTSLFILLFSAFIEAALIRLLPNFDDVQNSDDQNHNA